MGNAVLCSEETHKYDSLVTPFVIFSTLEQPVLSLALDIFVVASMMDWLFQGTGSHPLRSLVMDMVGNLLNMDMLFSSVELVSE